MKLEKSSPGSLIIKSSAVSFRILSGAISLWVIFFFGGLWITEDFAVSGEIGIIIGFLFLLSLTMLGFRVPTILAKFNKYEGYFTLEKKWIWSHQTVGKYPLATIKNVHVVKLGPTRKGRVYFEIKVQLTSGEWVRVNFIYLSEKHVRNKANELIEFLQPEYLKE